MKVCVSATAPGLDSQVNPRFGRCECFTFVDIDTMEYESLDNASITASGGAGIQAAQTAADKGVEAVLTGNVGPNALNALNAAGITIVTGVSGTVREAVQAYKNGAVSSGTPAPGNPTKTGANPKTGMGRGTGMGRCSGMGRGMGMGRGTGMGRGMGMGRGIGGGQSNPNIGAPPTPQLPQSDSKEAVISQLKDESTALKARLDFLLQKIDELENN